MRFPVTGQQGHGHRIIHLLHGSDWTGYGVFPFGERAHGIEGVFQTYGEYFNELDYVKVFRLVFYEKLNEDDQQEELNLIVFRNL